jgi:hypothetical protein
MIKMTATDKLEQIKQWIFSWSKETFMKYELPDGSVVVVNGEMKEGNKVFKQNEDETMTPLEDGEYILAGRTLKVAAGIIGSILTADEILGDTSVPPRIKEEIKQQKMNEKKLKFMTDALVDGTEVTISGDKVIAGADIRIMKDGEELLPPSGEIELKSGSVLVVDETGKITEVKPNDVETPEEDVNEPEEESMADKVIDETTDGSSKNIQTVMAEVMAAVEDLKNKMTEMSNNYSKMKEDFNTFKKEPKAEPIKRNSFNQEPQYQFGSGNNPRVAMIEKMRNSQ